MTHGWLSGTTLDMRGNHGGTTPDMRDNHAGQPGGHARDTEAEHLSSAAALLGLHPRVVSPRPRARRARRERETETDFPVGLAPLPQPPIYIYMCDCVPLRF
eukprot:11217768-Lingulodinium_polyedra.AAC.1